MSSKQLLITTDDFGMCHAINEGTVLALKAGVAQATNFLVPAPFFDEAVGMAKANGLKVGVHLCLTADWDILTWGPLTRAKGLTSPGGSMPARHKGLEELGATDEEIEAELREQIDRVLAAYGPPTHLDTHMMAGWRDPGIKARILNIVDKLADDYDLVYTYQRNHNTELRYFKDETCLSLLSFEGIFEQLAKWTEPGRYHLFGHAAVDSPELKAMCSPDHPSKLWAADLRVRDLAFFTDPTVKSRIEALGFELIPASALS